MWNIELHEIARKERYRRWILGWNYVWTCRICGYEGKENTNMHRNFVLFSKRYAEYFSYYHKRNVFDGLFSSNETFEYRKHVLLFQEKKKRKEWLRISFPSNVIPTFTSIEYINLHERSPNFTSLSACHPFENTKIPSTLLLVQTRHTPLDEEHSIRTMVERWIAFVVDERKKNEKKKDIRICLVRGWGEGRGWRTQAWSLWQGIVVCIYDTYANGTPFARANRLRFARSSRHAPIQITVHQAAYSRRYGTTPLKLTRRGKIIGESFARSRSKALNIRSGEIILCYLFYRWIDRDNILFIFESWRKMELE